MAGMAPQLVVLMRHGEAQSSYENPSRPLSDAGRAHVEKVACALAGIGPRLEQVRHSGKARALETAEIFAARVGVTADLVLQYDGLAPEDDVEVVAQELEREGRSVALVGHLPFMGLLASRLLSGEAGRLGFRFQDAACMVLCRIAGGWRLELFLSHDLMS